ncbi:MAG: LysM peptidoglycan-binding domain-containing protein [Pontiella sp.]
MRTIYPILFATLLALTGCEKDFASMEEREERDPNMISGQKFLADGNIDAAIEKFKLALEQEPLMARPHLDLALIYQQHKINYIHAIYHYDRYLELRPDAEKAEFIQEQKLKVATALATTLIHNSPNVKRLIQERNTLIQQNNELQRKLAAVLKASSTPTLTHTPPKVTPPAPTTPPPAARNQKHQIYHVVSGDTLTKISTKFYGDSEKWDIIYEANKDMMRSAGDLRVGQTIVIPTLGN